MINEERLEEQIKATEQAREAVEAALDRSGYRDLYDKSESSPLLWGESGLDVHVEGAVNGERVLFSLHVHIKSDEGSWFWKHRAFDHMAPGVNVLAEYCSRPGVVSSPERVQRDLVTDRDRTLAYKDYQEAKAECGPGEEPDMDEWRRRVVEHREAEYRKAKRRETERRRRERVLVIPYEPDDQS